MAAWLEIEGLRERERIHGIIDETVTDIIVGVNSKGILEYVSPSYKRITGHEPDKALGRPILDFTAFIHPDDADRVLKALEEPLSKDSTLRSRRIEFRYRRADGSYIWLETAVTYLFGDHREFRGGILTVRDVTGLKLVEEALAEN
jgi:PAS domain S-box-containing protein